LIARGAAPAALIAALVGAVALAGCGGGGRSTSIPANAPPGERVFADNCATCHTLSAAHATGTVGPSLDHKSLTAASVEERVRHGAAGMPAFSDQLSGTEIMQVSQYVSNASH
jgi:mono/diheme cytochrome c family protein